MAIQPLAWHGGYSTPQSMQPSKQDTRSSTGCITLTAAELIRSLADPNAQSRHETGMKHKPCDLKAGVEGACALLQPPQRTTQLKPERSRTCRGPRHPSITLCAYACAEKCILRR
jgi:hypothetical protein